MQNDCGNAMQIQGHILNVLWEYYCCYSYSVYPLIYHSLAAIGLGNKVKNHWLTDVSSFLNQHGHTKNEWIFWNIYDPVLWVDPWPICFTRPKDIPWKTMIKLGPLLLYKEAKCPFLMAKPIFGCVPLYKVT